MNRVNNEIPGNYERDLGIGLAQRIMNESIVLNSGAANTTASASKKKSGQNSMFWVTAIQADVYFEGEKITPDNTAKLDKITLQIENNSGGNVNFSDFPVDVFTLNNMCNNDRFNGYLLVKNQTVTYNVVHHVKNQTNGELEVIVNLLGVGIDPNHTDFERLYKTKLGNSVFRDKG